MDAHQGQGHPQPPPTMFFCKLTFLTDSFGKFASQVHFMNIEAAITFHINQANAYAA